MDGANPPVQVAVNFVAHTKWHLLLHTKNQAICHNAFSLLDQIQMFEPWSHPGRPHHVSFHLRILSSCPDKRPLPQAETTNRCPPLHKQACSNPRDITPRCPTALQIRPNDCILSRVMSVPQYSMGESVMQGRHNNYRVIQNDFK